MEIAITTGLIVFVAVALFLFVARRIFRLALKLAVVGALVFLIIAVAAAGWWRGWFGPESGSRDRPASQSNQRSNSNRRPSPR